MYGWECLWLCVIFLCTRYSFERIFVHGSIRQLIEEREKWGRKKRKTHWAFFFVLVYKEKSHLFFRFPCYAFLSVTFCKHLQFHLQHLLHNCKEQFNAFLKKTWENMWKACLELHAYVRLCTSISMVENKFHSEFFLNSEKEGNWKAYFEMRKNQFVAMYIRTSFFSIFTQQSSQKSLHIHELSIAVDGWVADFFSGGKKNVEIWKK